MEEKTYTPVEEGYWKCRVVFVDVRKKFVNGEPVETPHTILQVSVVPVTKDRDGTPAPENAQSYKFDLPLMFDASDTWRFWDDAAKQMVERTPTVEDTQAALKKAREAIPAWDKFINEVAQTHEEVFGWFYGDEFREQMLLCKLKEPRHYPGSDGTEKTAYDAILITPKAKVTAAAWTASKEKMAKALLKLPAKAAKKPATPSAPPPPPAAKAAPPPPAKGVKESSQAEAWEKYQAAGLQVSKWWDFAEAATGKSQMTCSAWTAADWGKVVNEIEVGF